MLMLAVDKNNIGGFGGLMPAWKKIKKKLEKMIQLEDFLAYYI